MVSEILMVSIEKLKNLNSSNLEICLSRMCLSGSGTIQRFFETWQEL